MTTSNSQRHESPEGRQALVKQEFKSDLPILDSRPQLSQAILDNQVVIVCGEVGSGKDDPAAESVWTSVVGCLA